MGSIHLFRDDIKEVDELPKITGRLPHELYETVLYSTKTDTYGPCLVCDIGDFNNLMTFKMEFKVPEHRIYPYCKFKINVFPRGSIDEARDWVKRELRFLRPWWDTDELGRRNCDYETALDKAERFPGIVRNLRGQEFQIRQMDIDYLILDKGRKPTYPKSSAWENVKHNLGLSC